MIASFEFARRIIPASSVLLLGLVSAIASGAPTGGFVAVLNEQSTNGDSMRSVTFFDAADANLPLFSVFIGYELPGNFEELSALTVNPANGDVYVVSFDSGNMGVPDSVGDTQGDLDISRIPFATIYDHWAANFKGKDAQALGLVTGPPPTGSKNMNNADYVTYGTGSFDPFHSNRIVLAGAVEKIGQINRGNGNNFFPFALEFIDQSTLVLLDDSIGQSVPDDPLDDHSVRILKRVSPSPGAAMSVSVNRGGVGSNYDNGGYNGGGTTESWQSSIVESVGTNDPFLLQLDNGGHAEPESMAYFHDQASGVRGVWITESDTPAAPGDAVAFLELDSNGDTLGYRPQVGAGSPFTLVLSNNPAAGEDQRGKTDNVFVDQDTGDLIIVESGSNDMADGVGPDHEPGVLRVPVDYDNGMGEIAFGTWRPKVILNPAKDPGDTFLERGHWSAYDSVKDTVWFFNPGGGSDTPAFEMDIYALDLMTGMTTSYLNVDDSVSLFLGDAFGDKAIFMNLAAQGLAGDYNNNGTVDAADYVRWRDNPDAFGGSPAGYNTWRANFGNSVGGGSGVLSAVPEPAAAMVAILGMFGLGLIHCRRLQ